MNLRNTLDSGRDLQARSELPPGQPVAELGARLERGLRWLIEQRDFTTAPAQAQWERARVQWLALADELDDRRSYPQGWTRNELDLVMAWANGDERSPEVYHSWDGERVTGGRVVLTAERFALPCKVKLPDGAVVHCVLRFRAGEESSPHVYDLWDLLNQFRLQRAFPGSQVVGDPAVLRQAEAARTARQGKE